jgi:hypothetical protein
MEDQEVRRSRLVGALCVASIVALISASGSLASNPEEVLVEAVAIEYARSLGASLMDAPEEATELGMTPNGLVDALPAGVHRVLSLDPAFVGDGDTSRLDRTLVATPLWLVVLKSSEGEAVLVSVDWEAGARTPRPAGMSWFSAVDLQRALDYFQGSSARVVWPVLDHPLVLGTDERGELMAAPVIDPESARHLGIKEWPVPVADYSDQLRDRMLSRSDSGGLGAAGGLHQPLGTQVRGPQADPLADLFLPLGVIVLAIALTLVRRQRAGI